MVRQRLPWKALGIFLLSWIATAGSGGAQPLPAAWQGEGDLALQRMRLLSQGEAALAAGHAAEAREAFDRLASTVHTAEVELPIVRSFMQGGDYRRALAFCAHAAGAHGEFPAGMALYAWLLHAGGQTSVARAVLNEALVRSPDDPTLLQARAALAGPWPVASGVLSQGAWRTAPYAWGSSAHSRSQVEGSGVLLQDGSAALVPSQLVDGAQNVWVRNGLGQTSEATIVRSLTSAPLTLLRLAQPLYPPPPTAYAMREPVAGKPGYTLEYALGAGTDAAWPLLRQGFFSNAPRDGGLRPLALGTSTGSHGGPVMDAQGQLVGIALNDAARGDRFLPVTAWAAEMPPQSNHLFDSSQTPSRMAIDEMYEKGLRTALQVIVVH